MTYKQLLEKLAKKEGFDPVYSINNLSVKECFYNDYIINTNKWYNWDDLADNETTREVNDLLK